MTSQPDHLADVRALRSLAGKADDRLDDLQGAIRRFDTIVGTWRTFGIRPRSLADAEVLVEGLRRALVNLRAQEVDPDAA